MSRASASRCRRFACRTWTPPRRASRDGWTPPWSTARSSSRCSRRRPTRASGSRPAARFHRRRPGRHRQVASVTELLHQIDGRFRPLRGRCLPYGEAITFWPVRGIVDEAGGEEALAAAGRRRGRDRIAELIRTAVGQTAGAAAAEETFWAIRRMLEACARPSTGRLLRRRALGLSDAAGPDRVPRRLDARRPCPDPGSGALRAARARPTWATPRARTQRSWRSSRSATR